jgi:DNA-binding NarL/FixJ family response regulator
MSALAQHKPDHEAPGPAPLKVLIADDHPLMLAGIRRALERGDGIEVVGEAHSGPELLDMIERRRPDVVLTDLMMPGVTGSECIEQIRATWPDVKVVVLSACDDRASINAALNAGASTYVVKSVIPADVASLLRQAANGSVFHGTPGPRLVAASGAPHEPEEPLLTERERTILTAIASGKTTAAISRELWVSEHTIKFHLTNIYRKLGVNNRAGAVRYGIQHGFVTG